MKLFALHRRQAAVRGVPAHRPSDGTSRSTPIMPRVSYETRSISRLRGGPCVACWRQRRSAVSPHSPPLPIPATQCDPSAGRNEIPMKLVLSCIGVRTAGSWPRSIGRPPHGCSLIPSSPQRGCDVCVPRGSVTPGPHAGRRRRWRTHVPRGTNCPQKTSGENLPLRISSDMIDGLGSFRSSPGAMRACVGDSEIQFDLDGHRRRRRCLTRHATASPFASRLAVE